MENLLSPADVAAYLGLSVQTIYNRHSQGGPLPTCFKVGNRLRFKQADVLDWVESLQSNPSSNLGKAPTPQNLEPKRKRGRPTKAEQIARRKLRTEQ